VTTVFQRVVQVRVGPPGGEGSRFGNDSDGSFGHHIKFATKSGDTGRPAECDLSIFNLNPRSRELFSNPKHVISIKVGHRARGARQIFQGNPTPNTLTTQKTGADWLTKITLRDGGQGYDTGRLEISFRGKTSPRQVLNAILDATGWGEGVVDLGDFQWKRRFVFSGPARTAMDLITSAPVGNRRWFIRDNNVYILKRGETTSEGAPLFSADSGTLIGTPEPVEGGGVRFKGILDASVRVGRVVKVESKYVTGFFTVVEANFAGSNFEGDYSVRVKGIPRA